MALLDRNKHDNKHHSGEFKAVKTLEGAES